jgi:hypothetical protein
VADVKSTLTNRMPTMHMPFSAAPAQPRAAAKRQNARASTGPRTAAGKARVARNALRHGLTAPVAADSAFAPQIEAMARKICGSLPNVRRDDWSRAMPEARFLHLARRIAEAASRMKGPRHFCQTNPPRRFGGTKPWSWADRIFAEQTQVASRRAHFGRTKPRRIS